MLSIAGSIVGGIFAFVKASLLAVAEYRLKLQAEERAAASQKAETDVRLLQAFTPLLDLANGRGGYEVSEKIIEELISRNIFGDTDFRDLKSFKKKLSEFPIIYLPVGLPSQDAAIAAVATLGLKYKILREPAVEALEGAKSFRKEVAEKHLKRMQSQASIEVP